MKMEKIMTTKYFCFGILKIYAHPCAETTQQLRIEIFVRCGCPLETQFRVLITRLMDEGFHERVT